LTMTLIPGGAITGMVLDTNGVPVSGMRVQALRTAYSNGLPRVQVDDERQTDDRGAFACTGLRRANFISLRFPPVRERGAGVDRLRSLPHSREPISPMLPMWKPRCG
jgi:hypothetical protein